MKSIKRGVLALLTLWAMMAVACNLASAPAVSPTATSSGDVSSLPSGGPPPQVTIESPASGSQALIGQQMTVRVHATDSAGITRIEMRESGRIVWSQPLPNPNPDVTALLVYQPTNIGRVTLEVVAYRQSRGSSPISLVVDVVRSAAELKNPGSLDPTMGVAAGAACTARVAINGLALRAGPGTNYRNIATLKVGEELSVNGRNADSSWYQVKRNNNQGSGWVSAPYTTTDTDCNTAPVVTPAPT